MNHGFTGLSSVRTAYIDPGISAITSGAQYARGALSGALTYSRSMISQMPTASEGYTLALSTLNSMGTTVIRSGSSLANSGAQYASQGMAQASAFGSRQMTNLSTALNPTYQFAVSKFSAMASTAAPYLNAVKTRAMDPAVSFVSTQLQSAGQAAGQAVALGSRQIQKMPTTTQAREAIVSTIKAMSDRSTTIGKTTVLVRNVVAVSVAVSAVAFGIWKLSTYIRDLKAQAAGAEAARATTEVERDDAVRARDAAETARDAAQGRITQVEAERDAAVRDDAVRARDAVVEAARATTEAERDAAEAARDAVTAQLAERNQEVIEFRRQFESATIEHQSACADHDAAAVKYAESLRSQDHEIDELDALISTYGEHINSIESKRERKRELLRLLKLHRKNC